MSVKSKVQDARSPGPKDPAFELLHPRDHTGKDAGEFIDVVGRMQMLGARWDEQQQHWIVPKNRTAELDDLLNHMGAKKLEVPEGMRLATPEDMAGKWQGQKIPPGWTSVVVATDPNAVVQVRGLDAKGRPQTIRLKDAVEKSAAEKFARIKLLHDRMPAVDEALAREAHGNDTAAAMMLIRKMGLRPGSTKDTRAAKQAYGASTLQRRHVQVTGDTVRLRFVGKEGVDLDLSLQDAELAKVLRSRLAGKPGDAPVFNTNATKMNRWVKENAGDGFTVKDFRTYMGTVTAAQMVAEHPTPATAKEHRAFQLKVAKHVSSILGNRPKQALDSYIDPAVFPEKPSGSSRDVVPGQAGRDALRAAFDAGHVAGDELTGGKMNLSIKRVTLSDGSQAVLKRPADAGEHRREVLSGVIANALGVDAHTADVGGGKLLSTLVPGVTGVEFLAADPATAEFLGLAHERAVHMPGAREIGVLDWLIRNRDRHAGNWIVTPSGDVAPIDHGLTFFTPNGADRDVPLSPFAHHWIGLSQKPTARPARGKTNGDGAFANGPKVRLDPKVSKAYVAQLRARLEAARAEFSDEEWAGLMARLDLLEAAAPAKIDGELPIGDMT